MSGIEDIVEFEDVTPVNDELVLLIDGHNIAYITVFSTIHSDYSDNGLFILWRHSFLNKLFHIIQTLNPTKVVLAFDTKGSWRYSIYEEYKANRKKQYGRYPLDKDGFMKALNEMIEDVSTIFTCIRTIKAKECEGDDIIAVLAKQVFTRQNEQVVIVSGDTDMNQLTSLHNVRQYDPRKNEYFNVLNPQKELQIKILSGDKSDNISPIKRGVGVKTAEKILNSIDGVDGFISMQETELQQKTISENYERNIKLINLDFIPNNIQHRIINAYEDFNWQPLNGKLVSKYFMRNKLKDMMHRWGTISKYLRMLD